MSRKRFTDAEKWRDPWFRGLPYGVKLAWLYLCDTCDAAGVWRVDPEGFAFETGLDCMDLTLDALRKSLGDRVVALDADRWLLVKFVAFQYPRGLSPASKPQKAVLDLLSRHSLTLSNGTVTLLRRVQDKETEKEKDTDKETDAAARPDPTDLFSPAPKFHVEPKSDSLSSPVEVVRNVRPPISDIDQLRHAGAFIARDEAGAWQLLVDTFTLDRLVTTIRKVVASGDRAFRSTVAAALGHAAPPTDEYRVIDGQRVRVIR